MRTAAIVVTGLVLWLLQGVVLAQGPVEPIVPPSAPGPAHPVTPSDEESKTEEPDPLFVESDRPWGLEPAVTSALAERVDAYLAFASWFTCNETVRRANNDGAGEASKEEVKRYSYILERDKEGTNLHESRQRLSNDGSVRGGEVEDAENFPPAYAWVFLFSRMQQPYFAFRDLGERFEGFNLVRDIQFRGALPFTDGLDIREWEGIAVVDQTTNLPLRILAQPAAQRERILAMFDRWTRAFNVVGFRLAPRPFGYRCHVAFGLEREGLTFPTELRYDRYRALSKYVRAPVSASIRNYDAYRFFKTGTSEDIETPDPRSRP